MNMFLSEYKRELRLLLDSGEYDDELINELGASFIREYRKHLSGLPYPLIHLGDDEDKVADLLFWIVTVSRNMLTEYRGTGG